MNAAEVTGPPLGELDRDGAFLEAIAETYGETRAKFVRRLAFGSGALLAALAAAPEAEAASDDVKILNFDLVFEYLQSSFYLDAVHVGTVHRMAPEKARWARVLGAHELAHVRILKSVLGKKAVKKPSFDFRGVTESQSAFIKTAVAMEDLTTALLAGQAPRFSDRGLTAAVFSLLTVEARHAAWARRIHGFLPVDKSVDPPKTISEVRNVVASTKFVVAHPRTKKRRKPRFTG
jgi:hypothetical protein